MSGNVTGGKKAADTNKERYGKEFYKKIGSKGGSVEHRDTRPFTKNRDLARKAGAKGGRKSTRKGISNRKI